MRAGSDPGQFRCLMHFQLSDVLKAIGPNASIIFAAWIFVSFLQTRYDSAIDRQRALIEAYRGGNHSPERGKAAKRQIEVYARRCMLMSRAVTIGLISAIFLLTTLIGGGLDVIFPHNSAIALICSITAFLGLALVIVAAAVVILENAGTPTQIREELEDVPDISSRSSTGSTKLTA
jgi:hypothetical protein